MLGDESDFYTEFSLAHTEFSWTAESEFLLYRSLVFTVSVERYPLRIGNDRDFLGKTRENEI